MRTIVAKKGTKIYFGSPPKIANKIGVTVLTVNRWIEKGEPKFKNGYEIYFDIEKL